MLDIESVCGCCQKMLLFHSNLAMVCSFELAMIGSFESTFCVICTREVLSGRCPHCSNELVSFVFSDALK